MLNKSLIALAALVAAATLAACGGSNDATTAADTGASASGAPCTQEAIDAGLATKATTEIKAISFACEGGWASGADLVGPDGSEEQVEAAFLLKDEGGTWVEPDPLPRDDASIPKKILDSSSCKVS